MNPTASRDIIIRYMFKLILFLIVFFVINVSPAFAISDPRAVPNNKVGINVLSPEAEIDETNTLVNTNGDWGYVVITIAKNERSLERWQSFLNKANDNHLIPIIRLVTAFDRENGYWEKPGENDAAEWSEFLSKLHFPTKNRYIQVYNEVNRGSEWGGNSDPASYAAELNKTIDALKSKNADFFVLNSPLDLALGDSSTTMEASQFFKEMDKAVPGIFKKLDGWASHSYPNPDFSASPSKTGRTGISGYDWELSEISSLTQGKKLPVFITETGWKRENDDEDGLTEEKISEYYDHAFGNVWNDDRVVAVAPFVLGYPETLFNQFSFKSQGDKSAFYKYFFTIRDLKKIKGDPERQSTLTDMKVFAPNYFIKNTQSYVTVTFKNTGNKVWNFGKNLKLKLRGEDENGYHVFWFKEKVYPGDQVLAIIRVGSEFAGIKATTIQVLDEEEILDQKTIYIRNETTLSLFLQKLNALL